MKNVIKFFKKSYATDRTAFYAEITETVILMIASAMMSLTIIKTATSNPYAYIFVPLYLIGSLLAVVSTYRRGSSAIILTTWLVGFNLWAFIQLFVL